LTDPVRALILGIVQGLTEFIPVSSSAHLVLVPWLFGWPGSGLAFDVALQLGTLLAVFVYFRDDLLGIARGSLRAIVRREPDGEPALRLAAALLVGSVPAAIVGFALENPIDQVFHAGERTEGSLLAIAGGLLVMGLLLVWAERTGTRTRLASSLGMGQVLLIGGAQALALMPGVSRSGSTITAGLLLGLQRPEAARFSFLLSVPITFGAGLLQAVRLLDEGGLPHGERLSFAVGVGAAAIVGYISIRFLLSFLQTHSNLPFAVYRVGLAILIGALVLLG
jgi:undecaprenyl-diphosphatase